jgi:pyruvate/2-oxoglutarate dehydrogenase complex dihydrolipoamide dehydrogenase (E3) component
MNTVDRAILDGEDTGLLKVHVAKGKGTILGATMVSAHAGESISEITLAITQGIGLGKISGVIHPYPTQAEAIKKAGDAFKRTKLTPTVAKVFKWLIGLQR